MDDSGYEVSGGDERTTGGLTRRFVFAMRIALIVGCAGLMAVTFTGDRFLLVEWLGHIHPLVWFPLLLLVPLAWMRRWIGLSAFGVVLFLLLLILHREQPNLFRLSTTQAASPNAEVTRLSFWNAMSFNRGKVGIADGFLSDDADIICLVEGTYGGQVHDSLSRAMGPEYNWTAVHQMAVGSRFPILRSRELPMRSRLRVFEVRILTADGPLGILLVDLPRPPRLDTRAILHELKAQVATAEEPFILVGDFNTARGSWRLDRATTGLSDFYTEASTSRWLASFPDMLPMWQIDHAFASPGIRPDFAAFDGHGASNHLRLRLGFTLEESAPGTHDQAFAPDPN